jgi:hypothetical protein
MSYPKPSTLLARALRLFGSRGQRWCKGSYQRKPCKKYPKGAFCSVGAVAHINTPREKQAKGYLQGASNYNVVCFNDHPKTKFSDIKHMFATAIALAKKEGN